MYLENLVFDAIEPRRLGRFWEDALGCERMTDESDIVETRLSLPGGAYLDLCLPRVSDPSQEPPRLRPLVGGPDGADRAIEWLAGQGAGRIEPDGADGVRWLADPEGNAFGVTVQEAYAGPLAAFLLDSADPERDAQFWTWLSGWEQTGSTTLRHPSGQAPVLELRAEASPKTAVKNRMHLDIRLEAGDDADEVAAGITARGGRELHFDWGDLPWRHFADPSGNELCVLRAPA